MKIFTFFAPVQDKIQEEELALIDLWKTSWKNCGWEPTVLTPDDLDKDWTTKKLLRHFDRLPTRNRRGLDLWCYARWLAVAQQGGGFMSDYDVINYHFYPREVGPLTTYDRWIPCLVSGSAEEYFRVVEWFAKKPIPWFNFFRKLHTSDMIILQERQTEFHQLRECVEFEVEGWETAATVHYSNRGMKKQGLVPRHLGIQKIRPLSSNLKIEEH